MRYVYYGISIILSLHHIQYYYYEPQDQYIFINDAILEAITCGDTQITASDLRRNMSDLDRRDHQTHLTGFEKQFKVCHNYL